MRTFLPVCVLAIVLAFTSTSDSAEGTAGRLLVIGGGLRPDNSSIYERFIKYAGGKETARFGLFPIASETVRPAQQVSLALQRYGVAPEQIEIIDLTLENATKQAFNPEIVAQIRRCTGVFFTGGDQRRIMQTLVGPDGEERPALGALREVVARGGVFAGSSAGAAIQSDLMLRVSGLPNDAIDEGMDALDFGLTTGSAKRGLQVTRGLGFFTAGIIDQHFHQFRGRLSRLTRAAIEHKRRFGFGVDENTALDIGPDGMIEVVGVGCMTVVYAGQAKLVDGPLGCQIRGVLISSLEEGDRFDTKNNQALISAGRRSIAGDEANNGNHIIGDIAGEGAVYYALTSGLADNTRSKQVGVTLKYNQLYGHGYQFTFEKLKQTQCFAGYSNGVYGYSVLGVQASVDPIGITRQPPSAFLPNDLPKGGGRRACEAMFFRGILLADQEGRFRAGERITRGEFASAMAQSLHIEPPRGDAPPVKDVSKDSPIFDDIIKVVSVGLMSLDRGGRFRENEPVNRFEAAQSLVLATESYNDASLDDMQTPCEDIHEVPENGRNAVFAALRAGLLKLEKNRFQPQAFLTREETAVALYRMIGFPW